MQEHDIVPADRVPPAQLHHAFSLAFADYLLGPFTMGLDAWPQFLARQGVDLPLSRVALRRGTPEAFALVAPRPDRQRWRLGTMGAVPAARGSGIAARLLDDFAARAQQAELRGVELECFAQNERALRLYTGRGFAQVAPLYGYARAADLPLPQAPGIAGTETDLADACDWLDRCGADLPLQVTPRSLRALPVRLRAWRHGSAQLVFSVADAGPVTLHSLVDASPAQADAQALVTGLLHACAGCAFHVPQLQRPDVGGEALERLGFARLPLHQLYLRREFPAFP
ncbi:MAG: GNAT family N-acetyltransferase [Ramlibacter sp.]